MPPRTTENLPIEERAKRFLATHGGNAERAVGVLLTDLRKTRHKLRDAQAETPYKPDGRAIELERENSELESEVDRLSGLIPAAGSIVLTSEQAAIWNQYTTLGKPEDLKKAITELPVLKAAQQDAAWTTAAKDAAKLLGWNEDAAAGGLKAAGLLFTTVDAKDAAGKDIKVPHVKLASADASTATVPLADWVKQNASYLMPALTAKGGTGDQQQQQQQTDTRFPEQRGEQSSSTGDVVADFAKKAQEERDSRSSPFAQRKVAAP